MHTHIRLCKLKVSRRARSQAKRARIPAPTATRLISKVCTVAGLYRMLWAVLAAITSCQHPKGMILAQASRQSLGTLGTSHTCQTPMRCMHSIAYASPCIYFGCSAHHSVHPFDLNMWHRSDSSLTASPRQPPGHCAIWVKRYGALLRCI